MKARTIILAAALTVVLCTPATAQVAAPPTYEYKVSMFPPNATAEQVEATLNQMGAQGWELVGVRSVTQFFPRAGNPDRRYEADGLQVILKRLRKGQ